MHVPEPLLSRCRFGSLGSELGVGVNVAEWQVAPHIPNLVAGLGQQLADHLLGLAAEGALEVAVLDDRDRSILGAADVIPGRIDVDREVEDVLGGAGDLARAQVCRDSPDHLHDEPSERRRKDQRAERAELCFGQ